MHLFSAVLGNVMVYILSFIMKAVIIHAVQWEDKYESPNCILSFGRFLNTKHTFKWASANLHKRGGNWLPSTDSIPSFHLWTCQFWNQHERLEAEGRTRAGEHMKAGKWVRTGDTAQDRDMEPDRNKVWANVKEWKGQQERERERKSTAAVVMFTHVMPV